MFSYQDKYRRQFSSKGSQGEPCPRCGSHCHLDMPDAPKWGEGADYSKKVGTVHRRFFLCDSEKCGDHFKQSDKCAAIQFRNRVVELEEQIKESR